MERYRNLGGDSGVVAYEIGAASIKVKFRNSDVYIYTRRSAGAAALAQMKKLALAGSGLATYISQVVKDRYATKE